MDCVPTGAGWTVVLLVWSAMLYVLAYNHGKGQV